MEQEFEFIKGFENRYKINKNGIVMGCAYNNIMKNQTTEDGYLFLRLVCSKQKKHKCSIHRLLAIQYIPNPDNLEQVDHIDRNKLNNDLSNLRWVSQTDNRRNRPDYKDHLTPEQLEARKARTRERARIWAEKKRREIGLPICESKIKYIGLELKEGKKYIPRV